MKRWFVAGMLVLGIGVNGHASSIDASYVDYSTLGAGVGVHLSSDRFNLFRINGGMDLVDQLNKFSLGGGVFIDFLPLVDFEVGANYQYWNLDMADNQHGFALNGKVAATIAPVVRMTGQAEYIKWVGEEDDLMLGAGLRVGLDPGPSGFVSFDRYLDAGQNVWRIGGRWAF